MDICGGFSYTGQEGILRCLACNMELEGAFTNMDAEKWSNIHLRLSPFCRNAKELPMAKRLRFLKSAADVDAVPVIQAHEVVPESRECQSCFFYPAAYYPDCEDLEFRKATFSEYEGPILIDDFLTAGYFLNQPPKDKVTCFWCNGSLECWNAGEVPMTEHAKYYPGCGYLRQIIGTEEIFRIREMMTYREEQAADNLRYSYNREILYEYYQAYNDINTRIRSLIISMLFSEHDAITLAVQGFHENEEMNSVQCYYCGLNVLRGIPLNAVRGNHTAMSPQCPIVRAERISSTKSYPDYVRQMKGQDKTKKMSENITPVEKEASEDLRVTPENHSDLRPAYNDVYKRIRSLTYGQFSEGHIHSLAMQGFYYNDEDLSLQCYYCGLSMHMPKDVDLNTVNEDHMAMSPKCPMVRDAGSSVSQIYASVRALNGSEILVFLDL